MIVMGYSVVTRDIGGIILLTLLFKEVVNIDVDNVCKSSTLFSLEFSVVASLAIMVLDVLVGL